MLGLWSVGTAPLGLKLHVAFVSLNGISIEQTSARIQKTIQEGIQLNMSTKESKKLLKRYINSQTNLVIMFVDINNSTQMSLALTEREFALLGRLSRRK